MLICVCLNREILCFWFAEVLHNLQYQQSPPLHGYMQTHRHKQISLINSKMTGLYLMNTVCKNQSATQRNQARKT